MLIARRLFVLLMVLGFASLAIAQDEGAGAGEKPKAKAARGDVVRVGEGELVVAVRGKRGESPTEKAFAIPASAAVRLERKKATLADLRPGMAAVVNLNPDGTVKSVSASYPKVVGTLKEVRDGALVLNVKKGKEQTEVTVPVAAGAKVQVDSNKSAALADLKPGMRVTVSQTGKPADLIVAKSPKAAGARKGAQNGNGNGGEDKPAEDAEDGGDGGMQ